MRRVVLALVLVLLALVAVPVSSEAAADRDEADRVLVVSLPRITWEDVTEARMPALWRLLARSTVAKLSPRTLGARTSLAEGYVTIGAGNRAGAPLSTEGLAFDRDETIEDQPVVDRWRLVTGRDDPGKATIFHLGVGSVQRSNESLRYEATPGDLGTTLRQGGKRTAVIGNADPSDGTPYRQAALALMNQYGVVDAGAVGPSIVADDPAAPFGRRLDLDRVEAVFDDVWRDDTVVLVEASDLERVDRFEPFTTTEGQEKLTRQSREEADALVRRLVDRVDLDRDAVIVLTPAPPRSGERLGVFAMAGPGIEPGLAVAGTTRRDGYVTLPDIAPTILDRIGVPVPNEIIGTEIVEGSHRAVDRGLARSFADDDEVTEFRDDVMGAVSTVFVVFQILVYMVAVAALTGRRQRWRPAVGFCALIVLAVPPLAYWSGLVRYDHLTSVGYGAALFAGGAVLAAGASGLGRLVGRRTPGVGALVAPLALIGLTWLTLIVDITTGGRLQIDTVFGYSPIVAGRFSGFGNQAFALVAMAAVVLVTGGWAIGRLRGHRAVGIMLGGAAALLLVTLVADGHPGLGSDVGGVLATVPAFAVVLSLLAGARISWQRVVLIGLSTAAVLAVFALIDLSRPPEVRTHLGRLIARAGDGGIGVALERKLLSNWNILTSSVWTLIIPFALAFLAFLTSRRQGFLRDLQERIPGMRACLWGGIVAGVLGFGLNDSGVAVPAMMFAVLLPYITYLVVETAPRGRVAERPPLREVAARVSARTAAR